MPEEVCQVHRACGQDWQVVEKEEDKLPICSSITAYRQFLCGERSNFALAIGWKIWLRVLFVYGPSEEYFELIIDN